MDEREELEFIEIEMWPLPKHNQYVMLRGARSRVLSVEYPHVYLWPEYSPHPFYVNIKDIATIKPQKKKKPSIYGFSSFNVSQDNFLD